MSMKTEKCSECGRKVIVKKDEFYEVKAPSEFPDYLRKKALTHTIYKKYMPISDYMRMVFDKTIYLSSGVKWNDTEDVKVMKSNPCMFATCLTFGKSENIAMWMLYSEAGGKHGVLVDYSKELIMKICDKKYDLQILLSDEKSETVAKDNYEVYLQDMIYYDYTSKSKNITYTYTDFHKTFSGCTSVADENMFAKFYAWHYEQECRLVVKLKEDIYGERFAEKKPMGVVFCLSAEDIAEVNKRTKVSPIADVNFWKKSDYYKKVEWELK